MMRMMLYEAAQSMLARSRSAWWGGERVMNSRLLVCRERSIVRGDEGRIMTRPSSRPEARSRLGCQTANELGAPVASSIPAQLPGHEPASARMGYEDGHALFLRYRRVSKDRLDVVVLPEGRLFSVSNDTAGWAELVVRLRPLTVSAIGLEPSGGYERGIIRTRAPLRRRKKIGCIP